MKGYWNRNDHFKPVTKKNEPVKVWQERRAAIREDGYSMVGYEEMAELFSGMDIQDILAFGAALIAPYVSGFGTEGEED